MQVHERDAEMIGVMEPCVRDLAPLERARQFRISHQNNCYDIVVFGIGQSHSNERP